MLAYLRPALVLLGLFTVLTGIVYPLAITAVAQAAFPRQANGNLIAKEGAVIGSALVGQNFSEPRYFWGRPSATSAPDPADATKTVAAPYNAAASTGSNLGPTAKALMERIQEDKARYGVEGQLPADMLTASGSGLDPHISPANARLQAVRVAEARSMSVADVQALVDQFTEERTLGILGERRVNVLRLNLALDEAARR